MSLSINGAETAIISYPELVSRFSHTQIKVGEFAKIVKEFQEKTAPITTNQHQGLIRFAAELSLEIASYEKTPTMKEEVAPLRLRMDNLQNLILSMIKTQPIAKKPVPTHSLKKQIAETQAQIEHLQSRVKPLLEKAEALKVKGCDINQDFIPHIGKLLEEMKSKKAELVSLQEQLKQRS